MATLELTKSRLLEAAGEEFAEKGYAAARVRTICDRAGANFAAVNYHFGGKEQLYVAVVLEAHRCGTAIPPPVASGEGTPAVHLRQYIHFFLSNVLAMNQQKNTWHSVLLLREMLQPTAALEALVREAIRPRFERLVEILRAACPEADELRLAALACSVVGQCLHYKTAAAITERLVGPEAYAALDIDYLTDHISRFCLAALGLAPPLNEAGEAEIPGALMAGGA
jgi:TetR/AcrR family transcriptional regulator, regulator of cefoperazone and chloramphenicol sensitivity